MSIKKFLLFFLLSLACGISAQTQQVVGKIDDDFCVTPSGQASYEIPVPTLPGTGGVAPRLSITYNSSTKNGLLGYGFDLTGLPIISRVPQNIINDGQAGSVTFSSSDRFAMDGARLVHTYTTGSGARVYSTENNSFSRITAYGQEGDPTMFTVETKSGLVYEFHANNRILDDNSAEPGLFWMPTKVSDTKGNYFSVSYIGNNIYNEIYPSHIDYTGNEAASLLPYASIRFTYEDNPDSAYTYIHGKIVRRLKCIRSIAAYYGQSKIRELSATYSVYNHRKLLSQVTETAADGTQKPPTTFQWYNAGALAASTTSSPTTVNSLYNVTLTVGDYNGDGKADFIATPKNGDAAYSGWQLFLSQGASFTYMNSGSLPSSDVEQVVSGDINGDGRDDFAVITRQSGIYYTTVYYSSDFSFTSNGSVFSNSRKYTIHTVESNGDGAADLFIAFEGRTDYELLRTFISGNNIWFYHTSGTCSEEWDNPVCIDFNGDGLTDILNMRSDGNRLMIANGNGGFTELPNTYYSSDYDISFGDFNGDGKTDMLVGSWNGTQWGNWWLAMSDGLSMLRQIRIDNPFQTRDKQIFVVDANADGYDDFYAVAKTEANGQMVQPVLYLNDGTGHFIAQPGGNGVYPTDKWNFYFGDFNGDGKTDFLCTSDWNNSNWRGYRLYQLPTAQNMLLASVTDGMGYTTEINYKYMSDPTVHTRGITANYPLSSFCTSWPVVSQVKTPDGIGGQLSTTYTYEDALIHRKGRGVLGFRKVVTTDEATNTTTTTEYGVNTSKYVTGVIHSETKVGSRKISEKSYEYSYPAGNVFTYHPTAITEKNYEYTSGSLTDSVRTTYSYDNFGNVTYSIAVAGSLTTYTINTYDNDTIQWHLGRLRTTYVDKSDAAGMFMRYATFDYDSASGLLSAEHSDPGNTTLGISKEYVHDAYGNITQSTQRPNDTAFAPRTESTAYDAKGRFIVSHTNSLGHTTTNIVNEASGLLEQSTDPNGLTTYYGYDSFGRNIEIVTPTATEQTTIGWSTGMTDAPTNALYYKRVETTGRPYVLEFFDCLGRTVRKVTENAFGQKVYSDVIYNHKGQVCKTSEPYYPANTPSWSIYSYDAAGRIATQKDASGATTTFAYNGLTTVTTDALGHRITRTRDFHGNLVETQDHEGGTVAYEYDVNARCTKVTGPRTTVTMEYDLTGNRITLNDPDLGTVTSIYNAYGEQVSQTDSKGTTTYTYDQGGRLITETRPDVTLTSLYDTQFIGALTKVRSSNGAYDLYGYDAYGRVVQQQKKIPGQTQFFTIHTAYNQQNNVETITYPNNFVVKYVYAGNGLLQSVKDNANQHTIWRVNARNARGQATSQTLGNGLTTLSSYDALGRVTSINTSGIQNWSYAYDAIGDLVRRTDNRRSRSETFGYDALNRLVSVSQGGVVTQQMGYDAAGNLTHKTDVGHDFVYASGTNRLTTYYADGRMPRQWDDIQYTSFHKIASISQGNDCLTLTYGPDKSRCKAVTLKDDVTETKFYVDNLYELVTSTSGTTRKLCYIFADGKNVAIRETQGNLTHFIYPHHDHLGSVQAFTDENGTLLQELSYDAWGCRRDPDTWERLACFTDADARNPWGFTGHEHIDLFELVNMDGRMYDPMLGRFLSPDPYVQAPDFTQGLNRYTYCLNNPLSLTDPSGYSWLSSNWKSLVASAVGIAVSALTAGSASGLGIAIIAGAVGGAAGALTGALLNGANLGQIAKATFTGAVIGAASGALNFLSADEDLLASIFKHTFSQGMLEGVQGGNMLHGFMMGAVSSTGGHYIDKYANTLGKVGEISANAVLSGTIDEIGGGKFANGAITGAFSVMFNDMMHKDQSDTKIVERDDSAEDPIFTSLAAGACVIIGDDAFGIGVVDDVLLVGLASAYIIYEGYTAINSFLSNSKDAIVIKAEHTKGTRPSTKDKHTKHRAGKSYGQQRNMNRGAKNKKYEHPMNPNKKK